MVRHRRSRRPVNQTAIARGRASHDVLTRQFTVLAQDPAILGPGGHALTTRVTLPAERLEPGPRGTGFTSSTTTPRRTPNYRPRERDLAADPSETVTDIQRLVGDPQFHQHNAYAIVIATMREFEVALGRIVDWGFASPAHQLKVALARG